jgi:hypothetical protein
MNTLQIAIVTSAIRSRVAELTQADEETDAAALLATIARDVPEASDIIAALVRAIDEAETAMEGVASRMQALATRQKRHRAKIDTMRGLLLTVMEAAGQTKWRHPEFTVTVSNGRPGVLITDEAVLPEWFVEVERKPKKDAIKRDLEQGLSVPGAELSNGFPTITVRTK